MGFLSNLFGGKTSEVEQPTTEDGRTAEASPQAAPVATVLCPVSGTVMDISEVNDPKTSEVEQPTTEDGRTAEASPQAAPVATVLCPVSGTVMDISEVNDPVFAGKAM